MKRSMLYKSHTNENGEQRRQIRLKKVPAVAPFEAELYCQLVPFTSRVVLKERAFACRNRHRTLTTLSRQLTMLAR